MVSVSQIAPAAPLRSRKRAPASPRKRLAILGATGSIGRSCAQVIAAAPEAGRRPHPSAVVWEPGNGYVAEEEAGGEVVHEEGAIEKID